MENVHEAYMEEALKLARRNMEELKGGPFGAIVVKGGEIVGTGYNNVLKTNDPTSHAEIAAIRDACDRLGTHHLEGCTIYSSCEPCPMCLGAIYWARIDSIYFAATRDDAASAGFADGHLYREMALDRKDRSIPAVRIMDNPGREVFDKWNELGLDIVY